MYLNGPRISRHDGAGDSFGIKGHQGKPRQTVSCRTCLSRWF